jgi:hypothetical protein
MTDDTYVWRICAAVQQFEQLSVRDMLSASAPDLTDPAFEIRVAEHLRQHPELIEAWQTFSYDQRGTPSPCFDGLETAFYDEGPRNVRVHPDRGAACADFIHRLSAWVLERRIVGGPSATDQRCDG